MRNPEEADSSLSGIRLFDLNGINYSYALKALFYKSSLICFHKVPPGKMNAEI